MLKSFVLSLLVMVAVQAVAEPISENLLRETLPQFKELMNSISSPYAIPRVSGQRAYDAYEYRMRVNQATRYNSLVSQIKEKVGAENFRAWCRQQLPHYLAEQNKLFENDSAEERDRRSELYTDVVERLPERMTVESQPATDRRERPPTRLQSYPFNYGSRPRRLP